MTDAFSLARPVALGLAVFITSLCAYPIFNRGPKARWEFLSLKAERFGFWHYAALSLVLAAAMYLIVRLFGWQ